MKSILLRSTTALALLTVAACTGDPLATEAGRADLTVTGFGAATTNNTLAQTGSGVIADINARFRAGAQDTVHFAFNQATLDAESRGVLDGQAAWIRSNPGIRFRVYGHTDLVGSERYNQGLGQRRANAVVSYLVSRGVSRGQLQAVSSFGETQPVVATPNRERLNRRAVTMVFGVTRAYRGHDFDGKVAQRLYGEYVSGSYGGESE